MGPAFPLWILRLCKINYLIIFWLFFTIFSQILQEECSIMLSKRNKTMFCGGNSCLQYACMTTKMQTNKHTYIHTNKQINKLANKLAKKNTHTMVQWTYIYPKIPNYIWDNLSIAFKKRGGGTFHLFTSNSILFCATLRQTPAEE